ncbi:MAG: hypothetical protein ACT4PP_15295 [Sporichthyaceae bacterium]
MGSATRDRRTPACEKERILRSVDRFWRPEDLAGSSSTNQHLLADLVADGELRRIRRGLYWRGSQSPLGMAPPPTDALVREIAPGPGVGPAGLYAANLLRLSTQVPRRAEIAVPTRAPESLGSIRFVSRPARAARAKAGLNQTEVALLEVLSSWESAIELPPREAWARLLELLSSGTARPDRLARAGRTEPASTRVLLRALLRASQRSDLADRIPDPDERTKAPANRVLASVA